MCWVPSIVAARQAAVLALALRWPLRASVWLLTAMEIVVAVGWVALPLPSPCLPLPSLRVGLPTAAGPVPLDRQEWRRMDD